MSKLSSQPVVNIWFSSLVCGDISLCALRFSFFSHYTFKTQEFQNGVRQGLQWSYQGLSDSIYKILFSGTIVCASSRTWIVLEFQTFFFFKNESVREKEVGEKTLNHSFSTHIQKQIHQETDIPFAEVNPGCHISNHSDTQFLFSGD